MSSNKGSQNKKVKLKVEYSSNNSGGSWWLYDKDWVKLEEAGWTIIWGGWVFSYPCPECKKQSDELSLEEKYGKEAKKHYSYHVYKCKEHDIFEVEDKAYDDKNSKMHRKYEGFEEANHGEKHLGAAAKKCYKYFNNIKEALEEFEKITEQNVTDEGCNCCGSPHSFTWSSSGCIDDNCKCKKGHEDYNYGSGESLIQYLYPNKKVPKNLREAMKNA